MAAETLGQTVYHRRLTNMFFRQWDDGTQQWSDDESREALFIERDLNLRHAKSGKRMHWCIVSRDGDRPNAKYPPIVAGPFPNIKAALTAYLVMVGGV